MFRLIGWADSDWRPGPWPQDSAVTPEKMVQLCSNMSGNAFCAYHYLAWLMASLATFGAFHSS
eukprot:8017769-Pyramimonas_sp.AAC.1